MNKVLCPFVKDAIDLVIAVVKVRPRPADLMVQRSKTWQYLCPGQCNLEQDLIPFNVVEPAGSKQACVFDRAQVGILRGGPPQRSSSPAV